jgi:hypothetical protein
MENIICHENNQISSPSTHRRQTNTYCDRTNQLKLQPHAKTEGLGSDSDETNMTTVYSINRENWGNQLSLFGFSANILT